jgi:hypothetical protein
MHAYNPLSPGMTLAIPQSPEHSGGMKHVMITDSNSEEIHGDKWEAAKEQYMFKYYAANGRRQ